MKIQLKDATYIDEVLCVTPLASDDWLVEFMWADTDDIHLDPAMVISVFE